MNFNPFPGNGSVMHSLMKTSCVKALLEGVGGIPLQSFIFVNNLVVRSLLVALLFFGVSAVVAQEADPPAEVVPSPLQTGGPFGAVDVKTFGQPPKVYHPETWFHFIGGNVAREGVNADISAIAKSGISGIQFFHGLHRDVGCWG